MNETVKNQILEVARKAVHTEMLALRHMEETLDDEFVKAVEIILGCCGKCIITGMGKSGLVGRKIAATLASTGTPSFFLHPGEAFHGDLGMISPEDVVVDEYLIALALDYVISGMFSVYRRWLQNGRKISADEVAKNIGIMSLGAVNAMLGEYCLETKKIMLS